MATLAPQSLRSQQPAARSGLREWIPVVAGLQTWTLTLALPHIVLDDLQRLLAVGIGLVHLFGMGLMPWLWRRSSDPLDRSVWGDCGRLALAILWQIPCLVAASHHSLSAILVLTTAMTVSLIGFERFVWRAVPVRRRWLGRLGFLALLAAYFLPLSVRHGEALLRKGTSARLSCTQTMNGLGWNAVRRVIP